MSAKEYMAAQAAEIKDITKRIDRKRERLARLRSRLTGTAVEMSDMPKGGGRQDSMQIGVGAVIELQESITADINLLAKTQTELTAVISTAKRAEHREILELRYVDGLEWKKIMRKMHYSEDGIYTLHGRALETVKIPQLHSNTQ